MVEVAGMEVAPVVVGMRALVEEADLVVLPAEEEATVGVLTEVAVVMEVVVVVASHKRLRLPAPAGGRPGLHIQSFLEYTRSLPFAFCFPIRSDFTLLRNIPLSSRHRKHWLHILVHPDTSSRPQHFSCFSPISIRDGRS